MKINDLIIDSSFKLITGQNPDVEIKGFYTGDLLSWVMSHAKEGDAWLTVQTHLNIVAIAKLLNLSCIIIVENAEIEPETVIKAKAENITLIHTNYNSFEVIKSILVKDD